MDPLRGVENSQLCTGGVSHLSWGLWSSGLVCDGPSQPKERHCSSPISPRNRMIRPMLPPFPPLFGQDFDATRRIRTKRSGFLHLHAVYTSRLFSAVFCFVLIFVLWTVSAVGCGRVSPRPAHSSAAGVIAKSYSCYIAYLHNSKCQSYTQCNSEHDPETET